MCAAYRAMRFDPPKPGAEPAANLYDDEALKVRVPTLVIWGLKDTSLLPGCAEGLERWVPEVEVQRVEDGSHWIVYENPALISAKIRAWLA